MGDAATAASTDSLSAVRLGAGRLARASLAVLRFTFSDRVGLTLLAWLVLAFGLRPIAMAAHHGEQAGLAGWLTRTLQQADIAQTAGMLQWASLAGLVLMVALLHVRVSHSDPRLFVSTRGRLMLGLAYAAAMTIGYLAFVWTANTTVALMLHDSFIFFDGVYRIEAGQVPSKDFPTALGAASLYLPALAVKLIGGYAGAVELASALVSVSLCAVCALASARRHSPGVTAVLVGVVFLMVAPTILEGYPSPSSFTLEGDDITIINGEFAQAMFYNRWGWGALVAVFAFLTPRRDGAQAPLSEIIALGLVLAFLFHLKLSYFVVGAAAAVLYAFLGAQPWRTLAIGGGVAAGVSLGVGLLIGNLFEYIRDVLEVAKISGGRALGLAALIQDNIVPLLAACAPIALVGLTRRGRSEDIWIVALIVLGTLFVVNQNAQSTGLPTLLSLAAYGVWRAGEGRHRAVRLSAALTFGVLSFAYVMDRGAALLDHTTLARREEARQPAPWSSIPVLRNIHVQERENMLAAFETASSQDDIRRAFLKAAFYGRRQFIRTGEYLMTLQAAMDELKPVMRASDSVAVMDFSNPLPFLMGARAPRGYWITFDSHRTISKTVHPAPEKLFADVDHVMVPKMAVEPNTAVLMQQLYGDWLATHYVERVETKYWVRYSGRLLVAAPPKP